MHTTGVVSCAPTPVVADASRTSHNIGGRTVRSETTMFLRQDPHALAVLITEAVSDDL